MKLGYKKCQPVDNNGIRLIGIFEIPDDCLFDKNFTNYFVKYFINKCKLIRIEDLEGNIVYYNQIKPVYFGNTETPNLIFSLNQYIELDTCGIMMFFDKIRALFYLIENPENGQLLRWRDDGSKYSEEYYLNFKKHGLFKYWHPNGYLYKVIRYSYDFPCDVETIYNNYGREINVIDHDRKIDLNYYLGKQT